jgi:hypothetical protein
MATYNKIYVSDTAEVKDLNVTGSFDLASLSLTATSNQIVLGTGTTTTINVVAPASSSIYTLPDLGTTADFVLTAGVQSITGVKTFTTPQIKDTGANSYNFVPSALGASRNITLPALGANDTFVFESFGQTLANKTLATPVITGQATAPLGTAGAPSYSFTGDVNTGLFSSGADAVDIATNGVSRLTVNNTGLSMGAGSLLATVNDAGAVTLVAGTTLAITLENASRYIVITSATGSTLTLPTGAGFNGISYTILRVNATGNTVINASGADKIDDGVLTTLTLSNQYQRATLTYINSQALWILT